MLLWLTSLFSVSVDEPAYQRRTNSIYSKAVISMNMLSWQRLAHENSPLATERKSNRADITTNSGDSTVLGQPPPPPHTQSVSYIL